MDKKLLEQVSKVSEEMREIGAITLPENYSIGNALQSAWYIITEMTFKDASDNYKEKKVVDHVTVESVQQALFKMVTEGLNPYKKQCSFIKRQNKLCCEREYQGTIALAKRYSCVHDVRAREVYEKDVFITEVKPDGRMVLIKHEQTLESMNGNIIGAYCVIVDKYGDENLTMMSMKKIETSWGQGFQYKQGKDGVHTKFADEMAKKTVINRACKPYINSSDDSSIISDNDYTQIDAPKEFNEIGFEELKAIQEPKEEPKLEPKPSETNQTHQQEDEAPY